ncbi:MAG: restriction endonuclease subunit S [Hyphomicrobiaceae bacterium]|nr:restriction endonuclease subunit S [Hyphomicrobiaceae bacterium]
MATTTLPALCSLVTDGTHDSPKILDNGVPFIKGKHISAGRVDFINCDFISEADHQKCVKRVKPTLNDVLFSNIGSVGDVARITDEVEFSIKNVALFRPNTEIVDPTYFYYLVTSSAFRGHILNLRSGAAQPFVSLDILRTTRFTFIPNKLLQQRIGQVLSAYDDLIENNRRRIALLEQAARELYREWFVRLRFPGHEHVKIVGGVPEGWLTTTLEEVCAPGDGIQTGPFGSQLHQSDYSDIGVPVVMPKDIADGRVSIASIARIPEQIAEKLSRHRMMPGDIVYGRRGEIGRKALISEAEVGWFCGTGCLRFRPNISRIVPLYLFELIGTQAVLGDIANRARGSTMPNLNATVLKDVKLVVANYKLQSDFAELAGPNLALARNLRAQNAELSHARDLLLPRLMNGSIAV